MFFVFFLRFFTIPVYATGKLKKSTVEKVSSFGVYEGYSVPEYKGFDYTSLYLTMRDSVMLATDIFLPKKLEEGKKKSYHSLFEPLCSLVEGQIPF